MERMTSTVRAAKTWRTWTVKELRRLEELRLEGKTATQIAGVLGRTLASVKVRLATEGLQRARSRQIRWLRLFRQPHTLASAAAAMGVGLNAAKRAKNRLRAAGFDVPMGVGRQSKFRVEIEL